MHYCSLNRCFITGGLITSHASAYVQVPPGGMLPPRLPPDSSPPWRHRAIHPRMVPGAGLSYDPAPAEQPWEPARRALCPKAPGLGSDQRTGRFTACGRQLRRLIGRLPDSSSLNAHASLHNLGDMKLAMAGLGLLGSWHKCWWCFIITVIYHYLHYNSALGPLLGLGHGCPGCREY